jgi:O-antigen/teichoic acid export membrane protein
MREIINALFKTSIGSAGTTIFGIISTKIMSIMLGVEGIGFLSLLRQLRQTTIILATVNGSTALVQGISSRDRSSGIIYARTVLFIMLTIGIIVCGLLIFFAPLISSRIFDRSDTIVISLIRWLALPISINILLIYCKGILNGYRAIGRLAIVDVINIFMLALLAYPISVFVKAGNLHAFIWMMSTATFTSMIFAYFFIRQGDFLKGFNLNIKMFIQAKEGRHFFSLSFMMLFSGFLSSIVILTIRAIVNQKNGLLGAGIFDAAWTICAMYVGLLSQSFGTYYLPKLSGIKKPNERVLLMRDMFRIVSMFLPTIIVTIILLKPFIISLLYSSEFMPSVKILRWMFIADYFKVTGWVFGFTLLAYVDAKVYYWKELLTQIVLIVATYVSIIMYNKIEGIGIGILIMYFLNLSYLAYYVWNRHGFSVTKNIASHWLSGLGWILLSSWFSWNLEHVNWIGTIAFITISILTSWMFLTNSEKNRIIKFVVKP